ncbi:exo-alpha-sialidase [Allopusillimonas soli]|uniref:Exo-alpha-sialidase n=1 Tax=Allopusillimonas soli TaxID=659016 RepID=A0A853FBS2_9BURK|nr:exo-alpha-sialidase [Allopusillimonas soli]NYT37369.1 exo-alpha-sialidase [Allopusillimonas soli]TEA74649.1 exo-alpha-sialidase [Allopusillimonas soli]
MKQSQASRRMPVVFVMMLLAAVAIILVRLAGAWLEDAQYCGEDGCLATLLAHWEWLSFPARALFCLIPVLLLATPPKRHARQGRVFRFWPLYFFLALLMLLTGLEYIYAVVGSAMAGSMSAFENFDPVQRLLYIVFFSPPIATVATVLLAWLPVSALCFAPEKDASATDSRGRRAFFAFSLFTAIFMVGLGWAHLYLVLFSDSDYVMFVGEWERTLGVSINWSILVTPIVLSLPVWVVAWWRDPGRSGLWRTIPVVLLALLLGATYALIGLLAALILSSDAFRRPEDLMHLVWGWLIWIWVANAMATWVAYVIVCGRRSRRESGNRALLPRAMLAMSNGLVVVVFYGVVGVIAAGKLGWTGSQPHRTVAADKANLAQIGTPYEGRCDGVVRAGGELWYLGYGDFWSGLKKLEKSGAVRDIAALVAGPDNPPYRTYSDHFTMLSRLTSDGALQPLFYVRGEACLISVPESRRVLLMTSLRNDTANPPATFESSDGGANWTEYTGKAFSSIDLNGAHFQADFVSRDELWLTYSPYEWGDRRPYIALSADGGDTAHSIAIPSESLSSLEDIMESLPAGSQVDVEQDQRVIYYLTYISKEKVVLWVSRMVGYHAPKDEAGKSRWHQAKRTDRLVLSHHGAGWTVDEVLHIDDLYIDGLAQAQGGPAYAVLDHEGARHGTIARLNAETLRWEPLPNTPDPFGLLGKSRIRNFWASRGTLVAEVDSDLKLPRWLRFGARDEFSVSAEAYYYSDDGGSNWHKLAIDDYPGVLGMDREQNRLYFQNYSRRTGTSPVYVLDLKP